MNSTPSNGVGGSTLPEKFGYTPSTFWTPEPAREQEGRGALASDERGWGGSASGRRNQNARLRTITSKVARDSGTMAKLPAFPYILLDMEPSNRA
jgi:hypothetical protein